MIDSMPSPHNLSTTNWSSTIELRPPLSLRNDSQKSDCHSDPVTPCVFKRIVFHKGEPYTVILCEASLHLFDSHVWGISTGHHYLRRMTGFPVRRCLFFHRAIMDCPAGMVVDHINGNPLDNRASNLRICTASQNAMNKVATRSVRTGGSFRGVSWNKRRNRWLAQIRHANKAIYIGLFERPDDAARAYDVKALELRGEFAQLNFPATAPLTGGVA